MYYTYAYLDATKKGEFKYGNFVFDAEPFYVGRGKGKRATRHFAERNRSNTFFYTKLRKLLKEGNKPKVQIIHNNLSYEASIACEIELISTIGRRNLEQGPLTNLTDGGEGAANVAISEVTKAKLSVKSKRPRKPLNEEHKKAIAKTLSGTTLPKEVKDKIRQKSMGNKNSAKGAQNRWYGWSKGSVSPKATYHYLIVSPSNVVFFINKGELKNFCKEYGLDEWFFRTTSSQNTLYETSIRKAVKGNTSGWYGFRTKYVTMDNQQPRLGLLFKEGLSKVQRLSRDASTPKWVEMESISSEMVI